MNKTSDTAAELPAFLARFTAAMNGHDTDAFMNCFAPDAVVEDEGHTYHGLDEIRAWIQNAFENARPLLAVQDAWEKGDQAWMRGPVSGTFPGSPVVLDYHLEVKSGVISHLRCVVA